MTTERVENMAGGTGHVLIKRLLDEKQLNGKCKMYAEVTLEPGCSLGYHEHHNESETIISFLVREFTVIMELSAW